MLRGTKRIKREYAILNARPTLQNQINALKAQVSKTKPETQHFRVSGSVISGGSTVTQPEQRNHLVTETLIGSTNFRNNVTGDQWVNKALELRVVKHPDCNFMRVIVYVPKTPGTRFSPTSNEFTDTLDPSSYWVLSDFTLTKTYGSGYSSHTQYVSFKGLKTIYDSNVGNVEKGEIVISTITDGSPADKMYEYGYRLMYSNL